MIKIKVNGKVYVFLDEYEILDYLDTIADDVYEESEEVKSNG